jgi:methylthioribose-1-phosphate isomerase
MSALPFPFPVVTWQEDRVVVLDQTRLPGEVAFLDCLNQEDL